MRNRLNGQKHSGKNTTRKIPQKKAKTVVKKMPPGAMSWQEYKRSALSDAERHELDEDIVVMAPIVHLAHLRRQQKVTQKQVADRLQTSQASVARMERTFTLRSLHRMARGMGLRVKIEITQNGNLIWPAR